jgi:hypothetical protein
MPRKCLGLQVSGGERGFEPSIQVLTRITWQLSLPAQGQAIKNNTVHRGQQGSRGLGWGKAKCAKSQAETGSDLPACRRNKRTTAAVLAV